MIFLIYRKPKVCFFLNKQLVLLLACGTERQSRCKKNVIEPASQRATELSAIQDPRPALASRERQRVRWCMKRWLGALPNSLVNMQPASGKLHFQMPAGLLPQGMYNYAILRVPRRINVEVKEREITIKDLSSLI